MFQLMSALVWVVTLSSSYNKCTLHKLSGKVLLNHSKQSDSVDADYDQDILMNAYC